MNNETNFTSKSGIPYNILTWQRLIVAALMWLVATVSMTLYVVGRLDGYTTVIIKHQSEILNSLFTNDAAQRDRDMEKFKRLDDMQKKLDALQVLVDGNIQKLDVLQQKLPTGKKPGKDNVPAPVPQ